MISIEISNAVLATFVKSEMKKSSHRCNLKVGDDAISIAPYSDRAATAITELGHLQGGLLSVVDKYTDLSPCKYDPGVKPRVTIRGWFDRLLI
jgi:hypothetical protein